MNKRSRIDNVDTFYEKKQDLKKIQDLEKQIEKLSLQNKELKELLIDEEYEFCDVCDFCTYKESNLINFCDDCNGCWCVDCNNLELCDICDDFCCEDCIYDNKNYYHLCKYCLRKEAIKTIKFNSIFRKYLFKIRN